MGLGDGGEAFDRVSFGKRLKRLGLLGGLVLIRTSSQGLPLVLSPSYMLLAFWVSAAVGIVFGLYPAIRASQLDPIVALRAE